MLRSVNLQPQPPKVSKALAPRPPLKWAGGKRWQVRHLIDVWRAESHRRLVEPFCGALAVTLGLLPDRALLNDINPHLINFYRWLKQGLVITLSMTNAKTRYYTHRKRFNKRCLRCLLLVMCTHPFAKEALMLHLPRSEGHERYLAVI